MPTLSVGDTLTDLQMLMASTHAYWSLVPDIPTSGRVLRRGWLCQPAFEAL